MADQRPQLAKLLIEKTAADTITWQQAPKEQSVVAVLGKGRVVVSRDEKDQNYIITIRVYDADGEIIETFDDEDLETIMSNMWYPRLDQMLKTAVRSATGSDAKLAEIIAELDDGPPF